MKYIHLLLFSVLLSFSNLGQAAIIGIGKINLKEKEPIITAYHGFFYLKSHSQNSFEIGVKNTSIEDLEPLLKVEFEEDIYSNEPYFGVSYLDFHSEDEKQETNVITLAEGGRIEKIAKSKKVLPLKIETAKSVEQASFELLAEEQLLKIKLEHDLSTYFFVFSLPKKINTANFSDGKGQSSGTFLKAEQLIANFEFPQKKKKKLALDIAVSSTSFDNAITYLKDEIYPFSSDQLMMNTFNEWKAFSEEFKLSPNDELRTEFLTSLILIQRNIAVEKGVYQPNALPNDAHSVALMSLLTPKMSKYLAERVWENTAKEGTLPSLAAQTLMTIYPTKDLELLEKVTQIYAKKHSYMPIQEGYQNYIEASILSHLGERSKARALFEEAFKYNRQMNSEGEIVLDAFGDPLAKTEKAVFPYDLRPAKNETSVAPLFDEMGWFISSENARDLSQMIGMYPILPTSKFYSLSTPKLDELSFEKFELKKEGNGKYIQEVKLNNDVRKVAFIQLDEAETSVNIYTSSTPSDLELVPSFKERTSFTYEPQTFMPRTVSNTDRFEDKLKISLECKDKGAVLYYTVNGSEPNENSRKYTIPFFITKDCTLKVKAIAEGMTWSDTFVKTYERTDK